MNIFILDDDPYVAAQYQCDKHIPKMVLESCQMLCTALHSIGNGTPHIYRPAYPNHPCTQWAKASRSNWHWLLEHANGLCIQYKKRFHRMHKCEEQIIPILNCRSLEAMPDLGLTPFAQAMPAHYKDPDPVWAYRAYYLGDKSRFAKWEKGVGAPWWWLENLTYVEPMKFRLANT